MGSHFKIEVERKKPEIHPIWRGIGFLLILVDLLVTFVLTNILVPILVASGYVPFEIIGNVNFPLWVFRVPLLGNIAAFMHGINNLTLDIITYFVVLLLLTTIFTLIYVVALQISGPPRYSETDAPPSRWKARKYRR